MVIEPRYAHVEGVDYTDIVAGDATFRFARSSNAITPGLLEALGDARKLAKREMAAAHEAGNVERAALLDAKQKAIKVTLTPDLHPPPSTDAVYRITD